MTDFFDKLSKAMSDGMTVNITVAKKGQKLNVLFVPIPKDKKREDITPFTIKGTGAEIDLAYDNTMLLGTAHIAGLESNADDFLKAAGVERTTKPAATQTDAFATQPPVEDVPKTEPATPPAAPPVIKEKPKAAPVAAPVAPPPTPEPVVQQGATPDPVAQPNQQFEAQGPTVQEGVPVQAPVAPPAAPSQPKPSDQW